MNIIYLGLVFDDEGIEEAKAYSKTSLQMATHKFQDTLLKGINERNDVTLHVINIPPVGSFPMNYKKPFIKERKWSDNNVRIGYPNIPVIKKIIQKDRIKREILKAYIPNDDNIVLMYTLHEPFVYGAVEAKRIRNDLRLCLLQTDAIAGRNGQEKYDSRAKAKSADRMIEAGKEIDSYILLSKHLKDVLEVGDRPYLIMEGICNNGQSVSKEKMESSNICLYLGTINEEYDIKELVDAFSEIKEAQLWLCGAGDAVPYVKRVCDDHDNIKYLGFVSGDEMKKVMDECDFLINPRKPTGTYTMYSFPSKTMEYLASGKPAIMYKLEGIPDEYDDYLNYLRSEKPVKEQLEEIFKCEYSSLIKKAERGCEFVRSAKSMQVQANRVVDFLRRESSV